MFGMSSKDFWENDPKLYWAYRIFYYKKIEQRVKMQELEDERIKRQCWLNGNMTCIAVSIALGNAFSKEQQHFPEYNEIFSNNEEAEPMTSKEKQLQAQAEFNTWARVSNILKSNEK